MLLLWQLTFVTCFASLVSGEITESAVENVGAVVKPKGRITDDDGDLCPMKNSRFPVYLPDPDDCTKFYICNSGTPHLKQCQSGLHYNPKIKACDYPENAGCDPDSVEKPKGRITDDDGGLCPIKNSRFPVYLPDLDDCTKFYICNSGTPHMQQCQLGLHYNPKIKACDYPENAGCDPGAVEKPKGRITEDEGDVCPMKNSRFPVYLPDPDDCTKFYICNSGTPHLKQCQSGLHYNPKIKACDYPENAGCDPSAVEKPKGRITEDEGDVCPMKNSRFPVYLPDPDDCTKFYICNSGTPHLKQCQSGLHYNPKIKACDYPENAGCDPGAVEKPKGRITEDEGDVCPMKNSRFPVYLPDPDDCTKFFICNSGTPHLKQCQSGLHYNPKIKACDYPENAGCDPGAVEKPKGRITEDEGDVCPMKNSRFPVYLPDPDDCTKFYICNSGTPHLKQCQSGLHYNPKIKACDYPENAGCDPGAVGKPKGRITEDEGDVCPLKNSRFPVYLPDLDDCTKFYICNSGTPHLQQCQLGLHYNPKIKACDYPENAGCDPDFSKKPRGKSFDDYLSISCPDENPLDNPILHSHPTDCGKYFICDHGKPVLQKCQPGLNFNAKLQACDYAENTVCGKQMSDILSGVPSPFCPPVDGKIPVFFRHPTNCSVFYMCGNGFAYERVCPARLHFNLRKKVCDYEHNANCKIVNP